MAIQNLAPKISYYGPLHPYPWSYKCSVGSDQRKVTYSHFMSFFHSYLLYSPSAIFDSNDLFLSHSFSSPTSSQLAENTSPPLTLPSSYPSSLYPYHFSPFPLINPLNCRFRVPSVRRSGPILRSVSQCL